MGPGQVFHEGAQVAVDLFRGHWEPFIGPVGGDAEGFETAAIQQFGQPGLQAVQVLRQLIGLVELGDAEYFFQPGFHLRPAIFIFQGQADHQLPLPDALHTRPFGGGAEVVGQFAHEPRAVLALQRQFVGLDDGM